MSTLLFVSDRFDEWAIAEWAGDSARTRASERSAIHAAFSRASVGEPWREFWGWLFESWANEPPNDVEMNPHRLGELISKGDRSRSIVTGIVENVRPYPVVGVRSSSREGGGRLRPARPREVLDIASIYVSSSNMMDHRPLSLSKTESRFLDELAHELEAAVRYGIDTARKLSGSSEKGLWRLGQLVRAYPVYSIDEHDHREDPDRFNRGIAPAAKLLFVVVRLLAVKDANLARAYLDRWLMDRSFVFVRLWAALARNPDLASAEQVATFLSRTSSDEFWKLGTYPEIAELRARRFSSLPSPAQTELTKRIIRLPRRQYWHSDLTVEQIDSGRRYWGVRELRRIEVAGGVLAGRAKAWLDQNIDAFPELRGMSSVDEGFDRGVEVHGSSTKADIGISTLSGSARLEALEVGLNTKWSFNEDKAGEARQWMQLPGSLELIISDLEEDGAAGAKFTEVWNALGWISPTDKAERDALALRMMSLIGKLPDKVLLVSIQSLAAWLSSWNGSIPRDAEAMALWNRLWPHAVEKTNEKGDEFFDFDTAFDKPLQRGERRYQLDTLNNPTGKLVGVFLDWLPNLRDVSKPFEDADLGSMRDLIFSAPGRAGVVGKSRLIQALGWMLAADPTWSKANLVRIMRDPVPERPYLWRALSWRTQFEAVLELGPEMADVAVDPAYDRDTRKAMAFSLVAHVLNALWDQKHAALPPGRLSQMLRSCDEEVRAHCANLISQFVREVGAKPLPGQSASLHAAEVFERAAAPMLATVWPHERSLSTPGVAKALADLPAASGEAFAAAVRAIERFIVPFDAWSMLEFGLYGSVDDSPKLDGIDNEEKATAFLKLLDLSIGRSERAVVPHDLAAALRQIEISAPKLIDGPRFRRLAALTRR